MARTSAGTGPGRYSRWCSRASKARCPPASGSSHEVRALAAGRPVEQPQEQERGDEVERERREDLVNPEERAEKRRDDAQTTPPRRLPTRHDHRKPRGHVWCDRDDGQPRAEGADPELTLAPDGEDPCTRHAGTRPTAMMSNGAVRSEVCARASTEPTNLATPSGRRPPGSRRRSRSGTLRRGAQRRWLRIARGWSMSVDDDRS